MNSQSKLGFLDITIIVLTFYVLGALLVETFWELSPEITKVLMYFDYVICGVFFVEFIYRFSTAESKLNFMKWGWIDLLSCVPMVDYLRAGRLLRLIRLLRIIRAFQSTRKLLNHIFANKAKGALTSVFLVAILLIIFSSIAILELETAKDSNIKTAEDAIWWTYTTITTVGYGDKYPVTTEGRILAMVLMTFGVGFFGTFTAYIASIFVKGNQSEKQDLNLNS